ncbi:MAG: phosphatase PAP2 family protein [Nitrospira sp.]|nr:phosphatase PAP2 family protein [Nitrospira sp.]
MIIFLKIYLTAFLFIIGIFDTSFAASTEEKPPSDNLCQEIQTKDDQEKKPELKLNTDYLKGYISDTKNILVSPFHWEKSDWIKASLIIGITAGFYAFDQEIQDWVKENRSDTLDEISRFVNPYRFLPPLGILYSYGYLFENKKAQRAALLSLESFVVTGVFTQAIKLATHRHRPRFGAPYNTWDGPSFAGCCRSFPSGHASFSFAIATVIASEYEDKALIPPLAYGIATLTALSRVNDKNHWTSDVFFGSALGYFIGKKIVSLHSKGGEGNLVILPLISDRYTALVVAYNF